MPTMPDDISRGMRIGAAIERLGNRLSGKQPGGLVTYEISQIEVDLDGMRLRAGSPAPVTERRNYWLFVEQALAPMTQPPGSGLSQALLDGWCHLPAVMGSASVTTAFGTQAAELMHRTVRVGDTRAQWMTEVLDVRVPDLSWWTDTTTHRVLDAVEEMHARIGLDTDGDYVVARPDPDGTGRIYRVFRGGMARSTLTHLSNRISPRHPYAGALTVWVSTPDRWERLVRGLPVLDGARVLDA